MKLSPGAHNLDAFVATAGTLATYEYVIDRLNSHDLAHLHLADHMTSLVDSPIATLEGRMFEHFRPLYRGTLIAGAGFTRKTGNEITENGLADLVAFGEPFIANPDLVRRFEHGLPLSESDRETYYQGGERGYTDYPGAS